ncbi:hypothetical protein [Paenibacillus alvei]|uniref:hypothetical protein n=1 Tax=Paenibacillus alvei TaxID=44250 RepID=UPI0013DA3D4C|nr:hypothetical protein [Paenibacillus alvei]
MHVTQERTAANVAQLCSCCEVDLPIDACWTSRMRTAAVCGAGVQLLRRESPDRCT